MKNPKTLFCNHPRFLYNTGMKYFFPFFFLVAGSSFAAPAYVPFTRLLNAEGYEVYLGGDYFKTERTVDEKANSSKLESGEKFNRTQGFAGVRYGLAKSFQIGIGGLYRSHSSTDIRNINGTDETFNASSSGLQSITTDLRLGLESTGAMTYSLEAFFRYVPNSYSDIKDTANFNYENDLVLGDVGPGFGAGVATTYQTLNNNFFSLRGGWRRPGTYLSPELYWQAEAGLAWSGFALLAGVDGVSSLKNGQTDRPVYNTGSSRLYHGENREWLQPYLGLNLSLGSNWRAELKAAQTLSGRSTDLGQTFGIQLVRRVEKDTTLSRDQRFKAYDVEASVSKVSPKQGYVVIDKGLSDDINTGLRIDLFDFDYVGGNDLVASGVVVKVQSDSAIVKVTKIYNKKIPMKTGLVARAKLR